MIKTPELCTYYAHSGSSSSVFDLTFANSKIENAITNWSIDENAVTGSDHEVIRFELIASFKNLTSHATALSKKYNCNKADWNKFAKYLDENSTIYESQVQSLLNNYQFDESAIYLQNVIKNAAEMFIPKTKICAKSKNWWSQDLTELRKTMCRHCREWKNYPSDFSHRTFKHSRIEYFHAIRKAKQQTWLTFLENAANKDVFTAYKYTKPRIFEKIPPILHENKLNVQFDDKCDAFVSAMYTKNPFIDDNDEDLSNQDSENDDNWTDLTENDMKNTISLFNPKKACGPDAINFSIVQKSFQSLKNVFFMIYSKFIRIGYHPLCWRTGLGAVLKKPNKSDYSFPKSYRIITLLNCLGKIAEKIVANRLAYFGENSNLLDMEQMGGLEFQIENTKESAKSSYYSTLSKIQSMNSDKSRVLLYTDGSKIEFATSAVTFAPIMRNWSSIINNFDRFIEKDCLIKYHTISKSWKLSKQSSIKNAELHAILQAMKWVYKLSNTNILSNLEKTIWIFSDSINAINEIQNLKNHIFARQIRKLAKRLFESNYQVILQWVPSHSNITENEIADKIAKTGHNQNLVESSAITFDYVKDQINQNMLTTWTNQWQQCKSKGKYYEKFEMKPGISRFYYLSNNCSKLIFATIMQLKFGHGYFRSYLHRLKDYNSSKCSNRCNQRQTPEHLLLNCIHYFDEIQNIKQNIDTTINLNMLFNTKIGNDILIKFIVNNKIATR